MSALGVSTSAPTGDGGNASVAKAAKTNTSIVFFMVFPPDDRDVGSWKVPPSGRRRNQKRRPSSGPGLPGAPPGGAYLRANVYSPEGSTLQAAPHRGGGRRSHL